jgi:SAM-dependent methyltransferase
MGLRLPYHETPDFGRFHKIKRLAPELLADILAYSKLPEDIVAKLISRELDSFVREWNRRKIADDYWFYLSSKNYFWGNLAHTDISCYLELVEKWVPSQGHILEYGAGVGHISFALAKLGYHAEYLELSALQKDFFRFRCSKNNVRAVILDAWSDLPLNRYDAILALDVFEHIPDAPELVRKQIGPALKVGGCLIDFTVYGQTPKDPMHLPHAHERALLKAFEEAGLRVATHQRDFRIWKKDA